MQRLLFPSKESDNSNKWIQDTEVHKVMEKMGKTF